MNKEVSIYVNDKGHIDVESSVTLKDVASTLERNKRYTVTIAPEPSLSDSDRFRKRFYKGIDIVCEETGNKKADVEKEIKNSIIREMLSEEKGIEYLNDKVNGEKEFSMTWLTPKGWQVLLNRFQWWAYNLCDCRV